MKAVLMSIQPKWCAKIANGEKTIEVRKSRPNLQTPFKVYIYCTNNKNQYLRKLGTSCREIFITESKDILGKTDKVKSIIGDTTTFWENGGYNGKVIGEFVCDSFYGITNFLPYDDEPHHSVLPCVLEQTCLEDYEIDEYLGKQDGYGWHIFDLKIYDKPKELSEFKRWNRTEENAPCAHTKWLFPDCKDCKECNLTRPPQSWCYVEELQNA